MLIAHNSVRVYGSLSMVAIFRLPLLLLAPIVSLLSMSASSPDTAGASRPHVLCLPEIYQVIDSDCLASGPSQYLKDMAVQGITFPLQPLPGVRPSEELRAVSNLYAQVVSPGAAVYSSLDDAVGGTAPRYTLEAGFDYISYIDRVEVNGRPYYAIDHGAWMRGGDLSRISAMPRFQGLEFFSTPTTDFGWVLFETVSKEEPGYANQDNEIQTYYRYDRVPVYQVRQVEGQDWYLIGPGEWIEGRRVGRVTPNPVPPEGVDNDRWVEVNLAEQTLAVYEDRAMVFATLMASGIPGQWTQPGLFQAYLKKANETMSGSFTTNRSDFYYLEDVPWTVYFDQARAFHGTYWHNSFGIPQSRGCVNLSTGDARWLFDWIEEGDWIYVWDPTGETPTDPSLYSAGGA